MKGTHMATLLLIIIYIAFISLGLPDSLLGSSWPSMQMDLGAPLSSAGIISMCISGGTIISSLLSARFIKKLGTGRVTLISVAMTAVALFGFSASHSVWMLCLMAIPLGLGAGSVDAALNNFVALHYKAIHMSWLHCFWGIGATSGPIIVSFFSVSKGDWQKGYLIISLIQFCLVAGLLVSLPLWAKFNKSVSNSETEEIAMDTNQNLFRVRGVKVALIAFICYCAVEATTGLWGSSYLVNYKGLDAASAARWIAFFYGGITIGRFFSGFLTLRFTNVQLIRGGQIVALLGAALLLLPLPVLVSAVGFVLIGLGCAPIYPSMLHETPERFGKELSQKIMGLQMAFAYIGTTVMPPAIGYLASKMSIRILPYCLILIIVLMLVASEKINYYMKTVLHVKE